MMRTRRRLRVRHVAIRCTPLRPPRPRILGEVRSTGWWKRAKPLPQRHQKEHLLHTRLLPFLLWQVRPRTPSISCARKVEWKLRQYILESPPQVL